MNTCTLSFANGLRDYHNTEYPDIHEIHDVTDFVELRGRDFLCGVFEGNYRKDVNFLWTDCIGMSCNNRRTDKPVTASDWYRNNRGIQCYCIEINNQSVPQFIAIFPLSETCSDADAVKSMKKQIQEQFPFFEPNATAVSQAFSGDPDSEEWMSSSGICIDQWLQLEEPFSALYGTQVTKKGDRTLGVDVLNMALSAVRYCFEFDAGPFKTPPDEQEWRSRIKLISQLVDAAETAS